MCSLQTRSAQAIAGYFRRRRDGDPPVRIGKIPWRLRRDPRAELNHCHDFRVGRGTRDDSGTWRTNPRAFAGVKDGGLLRACLSPSRFLPRREHPRDHLRAWRRTRASEMRKMMATPSQAKPCHQSPLSSRQTANAAARTETAVNSSIATGIAEDRPRPTGGAPRLLEEKKRARPTRKHGPPIRRFSQSRLTGPNVIPAKVPLSDRGPRPYRRHDVQDRRRCLCGMVTFQHQRDVS